MGLEEVELLQGYYSEEWGSDDIDCDDKNEFGE